VICGDGCLQEGVSSEASSLAGHLGLGSYIPFSRQLTHREPIYLAGKLIVLYDDNHITIDGDTALSFTEDVGARYESYGWHVQTVDDVNDIEAMRDAIYAAKAIEDKPSIIKV
jgi:transketolase